MNKIVFITLLAATHSQTSCRVTKRRTVSSTTQFLTLCRSKVNDGMAAAAKHVSIS